MHSPMCRSGLVALILVCSPIAVAAETEPEITCRATGYDVTLHNDTEIAIEAGTEVEWQVPFTRTTGTHTLRNNLGPGARVTLTGAMGSDYLVGDSPCEARIASGAVDD